MISMYPIRNDINNKILSSRCAMPMKDSTTDNGSDFSIARRAYIDGYIDPLSPNLVKKDNHTVTRSTVNNLLFGFRGGASINRNISSGASSVQKKWINGNRDASHIVETQHINNIAKNSINTTGQAFSMTSSNETNSVRQALQRTRNSGSTVPYKKTQKHVIRGSNSVF